MALRVKFKVPGWDASTFEKTDDMKKKLLLALMMGASVVSKAQLPPALESRLQDTLAYFQQHYHFKGLSAAVSYKNDGEWTSAVGMSTNSEPLNPDMLIGIGSNTKTVLSTLILKLYENGQINLTDTVGTWITGYPNIKGSITIRQLLTHTSGVADYLDNDALYDTLSNNPNKSWTREQLFDLIGTPYFNPGASIAYSNSNYIIAGKIVETITGQQLQDLFRDSIFDQVGLAHTFYPPFEPVTDTYAGFWTDLDGNGTLDFASNWNTTGSLFPVNINTIARDAGAIAATSKDVVLFWRNLLEGTIISKTTLDTKMFEWSGFGNANNEYGLGVFLEKYRGIDMFSHGGTWIGQINSNLNDTVNDIYIAVLSNQDSLDNDYTEMVVKALYDVLDSYQSLSVDEQSSDLEVTIYPNPSSEYLNIEIPANVSISNLAVQSLDGKKRVHFSEHETSSLQLNMKDLDTGMYLVTFTINNVTYSKKVLKMD